MFKRNRRNKYSKQITAKFNSPLIKSLQPLTSVTQGDFQCLYIATVQRFVEIFKEQNQRDTDAKLIDVFKQVIHALKRRQGYLLPIGADSETCFREHDVWTYAVFAAVLLKTFEPASRLTLIKTLLPEKGLAWLQRQANLFDVWQDYLQEKKLNIFSELIEPHQTTDNKKNKLADENISAVVALPPTLDNNTSIIINKLPETDFSFSKTKPTSSHSEADDFWQWLKESITNHTICLNQNSGIVYGVASGLLIRLPDAVDEFLSQRIKKIENTHSKSFIKQRLTLIKAIKKHPLLLRTEKGSRLHTYCLGQWQERDLIAGIIMPAAELLPAALPFIIHPELMVDPIANE